MRSKALETTMFLRKTKQCKAMERNVKPGNCKAKQNNEKANEARKSNAMQCKERNVMKSRAFKFEGFMELADFGVREHAREAWEAQWGASDTILADSFYLEGLEGDGGDGID